MNTYQFVVEVEAETEEHAQRVMVERIDVDEDLGSEYWISWSSTPFFQPELPLA